VLVAWSYPRLLLFVYLFLLLPVAYGQEYSYARYDVKDGLAGSVAYCATEDHDGFLWFGTETGLSRFDGTHFTNFTTADGLPDNEILRLFTDSKNRVWISSFSNAICYYYKGKIYNAKNDPLLSQLPISTDVLDVREDEDGCIAILETIALHIITPQKKVVTINRFYNKPFLAVKLGISEKGDFRVLLDCSYASKFLVNYRHALLQSSEKIDSVAPVAYNFNYFSPRLDILKDTAQKLHFIHYPGKKDIVCAPPEGYTNLSVIGDSVCAMNTSNGSLFYDINKGVFSRHCLKGKIINAVFRDSEDNYWFITQGAGIFRVGSFDFNNLMFTENKIDYYSIFSVARIGSSIYAGAEKSNVYKIDSQQGKLHVETIRLLQGSGYARINSIVNYPGKGIVFSSDRGVEALKKTPKRPYKQMPYAVKSMSLYEDWLLLNTHQGVYLAGESLRYDYSDGTGIYEGRATCSYGRNDTFYIGTLAGLYRVIGIGNKPAVFLGDRFPPFKIRITDIKQSEDGVLWIATNGKGIIGYRHDSVVYHIREKDGLTSNICRAIYITGKDVWVGTEKGLNRVRIQPRDYGITTFTSTDGLIANIVNAVYAAGNDVYVGTPEGLTYFNAGKISLHSYCRLRLTSIQTTQREWMYDTARFVLPQSDNDLRIGFVGISYRSAGDIRYRYRLVGLNDNWQTTRETFVSYPSLPSGDYELQLMATNKFGVESDMVKLPFGVKKLLWEENWFRILALVFIWVAIWIFVNARIKRVRRQNDQQMQVNNRMAELEQMALKAQMNPHFIFNSLNSLQQYVIEKDVVGANKFITDFSRLIRLTLDISSKTRINIYEEISYITTYLELEKTKFENKFSYEIVVSPDLHPADLYIPPMILQPYVENSIRHGVRNRSDNEGLITVSFTVDDSYLVCVVEDNGVGREVATRYKSNMPIEYQSKGMTLTAKRIEMLNRHQDAPVLITIEDLHKNDKPAGTRVSLRFPLQDTGRTI
jgi:ligand-binding sensor domain-containing protein